MRRNIRYADPFQQGDLDGLCGVYAVINGARIAGGVNARLSDKQAHDFFKFLMLRLAASGRLESVIHQGTTHWDLTFLLRSANEWMTRKIGLSISHRRAFGHVAVPLEDIFDRLAEHLHRPHTASIIGMYGHRLAHWTVARSVSRKEIRLADSSDGRRLLRSRTTANRNATGSVRSIAIVPTSIYLITAAPA